MLLGIVVFLSGCDSFLRQNIFFPWLLELNVLLLEHPATHSAEKPAPFGLPRQKSFRPRPL
jgi:hypothetical protein